MLKVPAPGSPPSSRGQQIESESTHLQAQHSASHAVGAHDCTSESTGSVSSLYGQAPPKTPTRSEGWARVKQQSLKHPGHLTVRSPEAVGGQWRVNIHNCRKQKVAGPRGLSPSLCAFCILLHRRLEAGSRGTALRQALGWVLAAPCGHFSGSLHRPAPAGGKKPRSSKGCPGLGYVVNLARGLQPLELTEWLGTSL